MSFFTLNSTADHAIISKKACKTEFDMVGGSFVHRKNNKYLMTLPWGTSDETSQGDER